jgi:hypothetical protein
MGTYHTKEGREITQHLNIRLSVKNKPYLTERDIEHVHSKRSDNTEPTIKTDTEPSEDQDTPVITCQESQIINQLTSIMSITTIVNISTIPQGMTGLSQVTTTPPHRGGRSGHQGGEREGKGRRASGLQTRVTH